jgi:hypothetical protein
LAAVGIGLVLAQTPAGKQIISEGQEFVGAFTTTPSAENSYANRVDGLGDGTVLQYDLGTNRHYDLLIFNDQDGQLTTDPAIVDGSDLLTIGNKTVPTGAREFTVTNPGFNEEEGTNPLIVTAEITEDGQTRTVQGVLEPVFPGNDTTVLQQGNIRTIQGGVNTDSQGNRTEGNTGKPINVVDFPSTPPTPQP